MEYLVAFGFAIAFGMILGLVAIGWACCAVASDADDAMERRKK